MTRQIKLIEMIATVGYIGKLPVAPGTWGSFAAFLTWYLIKPYMEDPHFLLLNLGIFFVGVVTAEILAEHWNEDDPSTIVIDEWVGQWIALYMVPHHFGWGLVAFLLFRLFDILKPGPIKLMENLQSGLGIMMDDLVAGILALLVTNSLIIFFT